MKQRELIFRIQEQLKLQGYRLRRTRANTKMRRMFGEYYVDSITDHVAPWRDGSNVNLDALARKLGIPLPRLAV